MPIYNRLIVRFNQNKAIDEFKLKHTSCKCNKLHYANAKKPLKDCSRLEQDLHNTMVITPAENQSNLPQDLYKQLADDPSTDYVQYDQKFELYAKKPAQKTNDWWYTAINYKKALMTYEPTRKPIKIAVIDTGIDHNHPDLDPNSFTDAPNRRDFTVLEWLDGELQNPKGDPIYLQTDEGYNDLHGTHVAGIIAALWNKTHMVGVANKAYLMNIRAYPGASEATLSAAIRYAVDNGARVINASWGSKLDPTNPNAGSTLNAAIKFACSKGVVIVCAAGNDGVHVKDYIPASFDNVITVGSIDKPTRPRAYKRAATSNDGANVISAPGIGISSLHADDDYKMLVFNGSSMAAAFVSGLVARMLDKNPDIISKSSNGACNVAETILNLIYKQPVEDSLGHGLIDVEQTLMNLPALPPE